MPLSSSVRYLSSPHKLDRRSTPGQHRCAPPVLLVVHLSLLKNLCGRKLKQLQLSQRYVSIACRMPNLLFLHNYRRRARLPVVLQVTATIGNSSFAVCHRHSAKDLPSVTLDKQHTTSTVPANGSLPSVFYRTLGKDFAES